MKRMAQFAGAFGSVLTNQGQSFTRVANPWVVRTVNQTTYGLKTAPAVTATVAGRSHIGCCSECSKGHRQS